jgi:uncharacterized protein YukE
MTDMFQVDYSRMAIGSSAMRSATAALRNEIQILSDAATKVRATWTAASQQAFDAHARNAFLKCDDIDRIITGHANLIDELSATTNQIDNYMATQLGA